MRKVFHASILVCVAIALLFFLFGMNPSSTNASTTNNTVTSISKETQKKLKLQAINQFYSLVDYDLETLDTYAPLDGEMDEYYKIFDEKAFQEKFQFFAKNYTSQGMNYGEDAFYDRDLIMRIGSRASVLRSRSNLLNNEQVNLGTDEIEMKDVFVKANEDRSDLYDLHVRFYHPKSEGYYDFVNEACWLTDRTCINTLGWKFLGRYNPYTKQRSFSQLNMKNI